MDILVDEEMTATIQILIGTMYMFLYGHSFGVYPLKKLFYINIKTWRTAVRISLFLKIKFDRNKCKFDLLVICSLFYSKLRPNKFSLADCEYLRTIHNSIFHAVIIK